MTDLARPQRVSTAAFAAVAFLAAATAGVAVAAAPLLIVIPPALLALWICATRIGLEATFLAFAVFAFSAPTFMEGFSGYAGYFTFFSTFGLLAVAARTVWRIEVHPVVKASASLAVVVSLVFLVINLSLRSRGFAITGWMSLVLPIAATAASAGVFTGLRYRSPEKYRRGIRVVLLTLIVGIGGNAALGLKQAFFGYTPYELASVLNSGSTYLVGGLVRPIGGYGSSQTYGLFMALLVPFVLFYATSLPKRWRGLALLLGVVGLVGLILSLLRGSMYGGLIAIAVGLILPANKYVREGLRRSRIVIPLVLVGIAGFAYTQADSPRWSAAIDRLASVFALSTDTSYNARTSRTLPRAIAAFENNLWGLGGGASGPVSQTHPDEAPLGPLTTDNGYLNLGIQFGIIGLAAILVALIGVMVYLLASPSPLARAAGLILVSLLVAMVFGGYWNLAGPMAIAGIVIGMGIADAGRRRAVDQARVYAPENDDDARTALAAR